MIFGNIFITLSIFNKPSFPNRQGQGAVILREGLPPHTCHMSGVTCHVSCVICHLSHVTCFFLQFFSFFFFYKVVMPCRILHSFLLSAAVIGVQPVLIIEVGTHWQQVKGIKSYLTLSRGSRSHVQTVHVQMSLC